MSCVLSREEIVRQFQGCIHCSQVVLAQWADALGYEEEDCLKLAAPFGGGCFRGDTCGAVAGAMLAIGIRYGHCELGDAAGNETTMEKTAQFQQKFLRRHGTLQCRELVPYDFSVPGQLEAAKESGVLLTQCPDYVISALEILDEIM